MKLFELAWACSQYSTDTNYDGSLAKLRRVTGDHLDPFDGSHRAALFAWLNAWGCRQFTKDQHASVASPALLTWAHTWASRLPPSSVQVTDLSDAEIRMCSAGYAALRDSPASTKLRTSGTRFTVTFGPTGAAKTLFALRPNVFAPWDESIREAMGWDAEVPSFGRYLRYLADNLRDLASEAGVGVEMLPAIMARPNSSPPKLVDEYDWIVHTMKCPRPSAFEADQWRGLIAQRLARIAVRP